MPERSSWSSVLDALDYHARARPHAPALVFLDERAALKHQLSFAELRAWAHNVSGALCAQTEPGERIAIVLPAGLEFVAAFLGCLYANVIPVPLSAPRGTHDVSGLVNLLDACDAGHVVSSRALIDQYREPVAATRNGVLANWLDVRMLSARVSLRYAGDPTAIAFLQYTSGSTAMPKGVAVTHKNLAANQEMILEAFEHDETSTFVSWLPLFHDQGLIGSVLQPIWAGATSVLMSPMTFLKRPWLWLRAISDFRARTSGGPNFAYEHVTRAITPERMRGVDLSSWRVAFNGAEPVRASTLDAFSHVLSPYGFRATSHYPCYGLAEATLFVSGGTPGRVPRRLEVDLSALALGEVTLTGGRNKTAHISCGSSRAGLEIAIVDPASRAREAAYRVGEVWLRGSSVAAGYYRDPVATETAFAARLRERSQVDYLRTGDLGFLDEQGELFLVGRSKDLLIIEGRNIYPHDLERTVQDSHPQLQLCPNAAFSVEHADNAELVIVQEVARTAGFDLTAAGRAVRRALRESHGVSPLEVVWVRRGEVPRTTSGKVRRAEARRKYLAGSYELPR